MTFCVKKKALFILFFLLLIFVLFVTFPAEVLANNVTVKLVWKFPDAGWVQVEVRQGNYQLHFNGQSITLSPGDSIKLGQSSIFPFLLKNDNLIILDNPVISLINNDNGIFRIREPGKDWMSYRGDLSINKEGISWGLSNTLEQEQYLKGVVPIEMSNAWAAKGFEALKAQAVAARTYMLKNMDSSRVITDSPNIHQAYMGRTVEGAASLAVEQTAGQILVDQVTGEPISVYYSAHNGGHTEETQNVWKSHDPHYPTFPDPYSVGVGGYVGNWSFYIASDALGQAFGLAPVREIKLDKLASGRVYRVQMEDWLGNTKDVTGGEFVQKFYPYGRSITASSFLGRLFEVHTILPEPPNTTFLIISPIHKYQSDVPGPVSSKLISSNEGISDYPRHMKIYAFHGSGWGHGVGMSQWGAYNMAMKGYSYEDILLHYYRHTVLQRR